MFWRVGAVWWKIAENFFSLLENVDAGTEWRGARGIGGRGGAVETLAENCGR